MLPRGCARPALHDVVVAHVENDGMLWLRYDVLREADR